MFALEEMALLAAEEVSYEILQQTLDSSYTESNHVPCHSSSAC